MNRTVTSGRAHTLKMQRNALFVVRPWIPMPRISMKNSCHLGFWYIFCRVETCVRSRCSSPKWVPWLCCTLPILLSHLISLLCGSRPQNGSMILYNRKKVKYRKDGYCWKKRKDGKTTREDHMKLKVQGVEVSGVVWGGVGETKCERKGWGKELGWEPTFILTQTNEGLHWLLPWL